MKGDEDYPEIPGMPACGLDTGPWVSARASSDAGTVILTLAKQIEGGLRRF